MLFTQDILVQAIGFSHQSPQMIAFDRPFEERFGCPNEDLRILFGRLIGHTHRPRRETFPLFVQSGNALLSAEFIMFRKRIRHFSPDSPQ